MDTKHTRPILIVLYVGVLMGTLDIAIVAPALPQIQQVFNVTARHLSWVFAIYVLFNLIGTPIMSKLSDMYGRRVIYVIDVALFAAGSLLVVISPSDNFTDLLIGREEQPRVLAAAVSSLWQVLSSAISCRRNDVDVPWVSSAP